MLCSPMTTRCVLHTGPPEGIDGSGMGAWVHASFFSGWQWGRWPPRNLLMKFLWQCHHSRCWNHRPFPSCEFMFRRVGFQIFLWVPEDTYRCRLRNSTEHSPCSKERMLPSSMLPIHSVYDMCPNRLREFGIACCRSEWNIRGTGTRMEFLRESLG